MFSMTVLALFLLPPSLVILGVVLKSSVPYIILKWWQNFETWFQVYQCYKVPLHNEVFQENQLYRKILVYLNSLPSLEDSDCTNLFSGSKPNDIILRFGSDQTLHDSFLGARVSWSIEKSESDGHSGLVLRIRKKDKRRIFRRYFQHILSVVDEIEQGRKEIKLYLNLGRKDRGNAQWQAVPFTHPASFDTVAMDSVLKNRVKSDLEQFLKSKQYYQRSGRVWKRSYLLYGASGTGKSTFIAAMARFLCYDVYDIDISNVFDDTDLKNLLLQTSNRSLIVVEDLNRFLIEDSTDVSFSGLLNFMDGIVSWCGDERVMVFTSHDKDHLHPTVMRPGRIDVHIHFPACDFFTFKSLSTNYLGVKEHKLFSQVEDIFQTGSSLSPAEISGLMISNRNSPSRALKSIITALQTYGGGRRRADQGANRRQGESGSGQSSDESGDPSIIISKDGIHRMREIRKLYGLLRLGSKRKESIYCAPIVKFSSNNETEIANVIRS